MADIYSQLTKYSIPDSNDTFKDEFGFEIKTKSVLSNSRYAIIVTKNNIHSIWESGIPNYSSFCFYVHQMDWGKKTDEELNVYIEENINKCRKMCLDKANYLLYMVNEFNTKI